MSTPTRTDRETLVHELCSSVDSGDAAGFAARFTEGARYRFAHHEVLVGRAAIEAATAGAAGALPWVRHTVDQVAEVGDQLFCRFTIETQAPDGRQLALPCVTVIELDPRSGLIDDYRVHMDLTPALG